MRTAVYIFTEVSSRPKTLTVQNGKVSLRFINFGKIEVYVWFIF